MTEDGFRGHERGQNRLWVEAVSSGVDVAKQGNSDGAEEVR